jgi:hypothetical protein
MKQTAVEWLEKQFVKLESTIGVHGVMYELMEQAKEMEKEKIENAYQQGYNNAYFNNPISKDQYYNQTFKQD